jgi:acyl-CoA synthetase (NDP forming)
LTVDPIIAAARDAGRGALDEAAGKRLLAQYGIAVPRFEIATGPDDAARAFAALTPPVVVKIMSPDLLHKSDAGGVAIGLESAVAVRDAIDAMAGSPAALDRRIDGFLVEEMAPAGQEVVIGGVQAPQFGPMVMVGIGGVFVELLGDVAFRLCPIDEADAWEMLRELRGAPLLAGARGGQPVSQAAIVDALLRIGGAGGLLLDLAGDVAELDINPVIVSRVGAVAVDARVILNAEGPTDEGAEPAPVDFAPLFAPRAVAVVGASADRITPGNTCIARLREAGYDGAIYPIHPSAAAIDGLPAYRSLRDTPEPIDYAYIAVAAARVPAMLRAADGRLRFAQVISAGFGEVADGVELQRDLVAAARAGGCRVIGPNCLGLYSPRGRMSFAKGSSMDQGRVGVISQSGGLGTDIVRRGHVRGVRFHSLVTLGNSADIGPNDLLDYYLNDPECDVVGMYLEDVKDGGRFARILRAAKSKKPVVILKGGRTGAGQAAAASHTGSLAGDDRVWVALEKQSGCVLVDTLDDFVDTLLAFQMLKLNGERPVKRVVLFGNGGGASVLATDYFARLGLDIDPLGAAARAALEALALPPGTSIVNPIDTPVGTLQTENGRIAEKILDAVYAAGDADAVVMHLNLAAFVGRGNVDPLENLIQAALRVQSRYPGQAHFLLVLRSDGGAEIDAAKRDYRARALAANIPVYDELPNAARVLAAVGRVEKFRHRHANGSGRHKSTTAETRTGLPRR